MAGYYARETRRLSLAVSVTILFSACGDSPTSPGATDRPPTPTYTLSGVVTVATEKGTVLVTGARVEESNSRRAAITDLNGFYSISGLTPTNNVVTVSKAGYVSDTRPVTINSDTRLDIEVALVPVVTYTLTGVVSEMTETGLVPVEGVQLVLRRLWQRVWSHLHVHRQQRVLQLLLAVSRPPDAACFEGGLPDAFGATGRDLHHDRDGRYPIGLPTRPSLNSDR